jgi:hypothetical protein
MTAPKCPGATPEEVGARLAAEFVEGLNRLPGEVLALLAHPQLRGMVLLRVRTDAQLRARILASLPDSEESRVLVEDWPHVRKGMEPVLRAQLLGDLATTVLLLLEATLTSKGGGVA